MAWLPRQFQNGGLRSQQQRLKSIYQDEFLQDRRDIAGTRQAETSVSGKAECLLAIGKDKKVSFLE